jgi:TorA maturation chaperone TorD
MTMSTRGTTSRAPEELAARGTAFALVGRMLGHDTSAVADPDAVSALRYALERSKCMAATRCVDELDPAAGGCPEQLRNRWVKWFDLGRVAPYEGSNIPPSSGGITPRLADIAGFYRAFGFEVQGNRPDHVVAELEFVGLLLLLESDARRRDDAEQAEIVADAARSFLRDHLAGWLDAWAGRVGAIDDLAPWAPFAAAAAALMKAEVSERNVIPLRPAAVLEAEQAVAGDDEAWLACQV